MQGCSIVIRVRIEPKSCDQDRRKNYVFILSATLPTYLIIPVCLDKGIAFHQTDPGFLYWDWSKSSEKKSISVNQYEINLAVKL